MLTTKDKEWLQQQLANVATQDDLTKLRGYLEGSLSVMQKTLMDEMGRVYTDLHHRLTVIESHLNIKR